MYDVIEQSIEQGFAPLFLVGGGVVVMTLLILWGDSLAESLSPEGGSRVLISSSLRILSVAFFVVWSMSAIGVKL